MDTRKSEVGGGYMTGMSMFIVLPLVVCIGGREETIVTEGSDLMSLVI